MGNKAGAAFILMTLLVLAVAHASAATAAGGEDGGMMYSTGARKLLQTIPCLLDNMCGEGRFCGFGGQCKDLAQDGEACGLVTSGRAPCAPGYTCRDADYDEDIPGVCRPDLDA